jgi:hypothetical protein
MVKRSACTLMGSIRLAAGPGTAGSKLRTWSRRFLPPLLAVVVLTGPASPAQAQNPPSSFQWFSLVSFWRTKSVSEPVSADQSDKVRLVNQFNYKIYRTDGNYSDSYYANTHSNSSTTAVRPYGYRTNLGFTNPAWTVGPGQATINVPGSNGYVDPNFANNVPFPSNWIQSGTSGDRHTVIWQPSTDKMWEFWHCTGTYPSIRADWGGRISSVSTSNGIIGAPYGATATGLPLVGGMITRYEAQQIAANPTSSGNLIPHVLALALPEIANYHVAPANRHDGVPYAGVYPVAEGRRFRLPANVAVPSGPPLLRAIVIAARDYGMVNRDGTATVISLYGEQNKPGDTDYWTAARGGQPFYSILDAFPWSQLQQLNPITPGLLNGGFEANGATQTPSAWSTWSSNGVNNQDYTETGATHSGSWKLTHWSSSAYQVTTYQLVKGLANGSYKVSAWVRRGGTFNYSRMEVVNYGASQVNVNLPNSTTYQLVTTTVNVTNGQLQVSFYSNGAANAWANIDDVSVVKL